MRNFTDLITKLAGSKSLALQSKAPTIFFAVGVTGMVASTVLACRATLQLTEVLDEFVDDTAHEDDVNLTQKGRAVVAIGKLYAPAAVIGVASITMLAKSHSTLVKRNAALSAAYTLLDKGFRDYRARVVEKYGQEADEDFRYGSITEKAKTVDGKKVPGVRKVNPETGASIYARFFDETNSNWNRDPEINKLFLRSQQNYLNDLLLARGHLFLNEVYDALGFSHSKPGQVVGWIVGNDSEGDNYVDLGVFTGHASEQVREFVNGREAAVLLDFNVDGVILDNISEEFAPVIRRNRGL